MLPQEDEANAAQADEDKRPVQLLQQRAVVDDAESVQHIQREDGHPQQQNEQPAQNVADAREQIGQVGFDAFPAEFTILH